jgi:hypothetical protein
MHFQNVVVVIYYDYVCKNQANILIQTRVIFLLSILILRKLSSDNDMDVDYFIILLENITNGKGRMKFIINTVI